MGARREGARRPAAAQGQPHSRMGMSHPHCPSQAELTLFTLTQRPLQTQALRNGDGPHAPPAAPLPSEHRGRGPRSNWRCVGWRTSMSDKSGGRNSSRFRNQARKLLHQHPTLPPPQPRAGPCSAAHRSRAEACGMDADRHRGPGEGCFQPPGCLVFPAFPGPGGCPGSMADHERPPSLCSPTCEALGPASHCLP